MSAKRLTPAIYRELLAAFRDGCNQSDAAARVGLDYDFTRNVWHGRFKHVHPWAVAIKDIISGAIPEPEIPTGLPEPGKDAKPGKPAMVGKVVSITPRQTTRRATTSRPMFDGSSVQGIEELPSEPLPTDPVEARAELINRLKQGAGARLLVFNEVGPKFDAYIRWLASANLSYAQSMSGPDAIVSPSDLVVASQLAGLFAQVMEKSASAVERVLALEDRLAPPTATGKTTLSHEDAMKRVESVVQRWGPLLSQAVAKKAADGSH